MPKKKEPTRAKRDADLKRLAELPDPMGGVKMKPPHIAKKATLPKNRDEQVTHNYQPPRKKKGG